MSSPPLRVFLTREQDRKLLELKRTAHVPQIAKDRAELLRLSSRGWKVEQLASYLNWTSGRVRATIHRWQNSGLAGLWNAPRSGRKPKWRPEDIESVEAVLAKEQRTYNSSQLCQKLAENLTCSPEYPSIKKDTQKKGVIWKRTRASHRQKQNPDVRSLAQADLDMLEIAAAAGEISLKYLDESGFSLWSAVSYTWFFRGQQKCLEQTKRRGRRLSICALMESGKSFNYALAIKGFKSHSYISVMDWEAQNAQQRFQQTGVITVVVQDQGSIHTSKAVKERLREWERQGLYIFQLPKYCSQMNLIESEWLHLKADEIAGRMFDSEYDLAMAVIQAIEERATKKGYQVERFRFPSG